MAKPMTTSEPVGRRARADGGRRGIGTKAWTWPMVIWASLLILTVFSLFPVVWMLLTALKPAAEVNAFPPTLLPDEWRWQNIPDALTFAPFGRYLFNSLVMSGGIAIIVLFTSALSAYAFARLQFRGRDALFLLYLGTLMIPPQVTLVPEFIIVQALGWVDTYQGLIIPNAFKAFGVFLLRQFFLQIPHELEEAARIDGASRFGCFWRIILPLSGPALATLGVFMFLFQWNNFLWPLIVSNTDATRPVVVGLSVFQDQYFTQWELLMAAATVSTVPVLIVFLVAQRWFVRGIATSGFGGR